MTTTVAAVYENGILRPLEPLSLSEGQRVQIAVSAEGAANPRNVGAIMAEIAALPVEGACDPFTSRDHDQVLYGAKGQP
jgi:predicted DNA-binding antitoxin AbrB/MazE fold protein